MILWDVAAIKSVILTKLWILHFPIYSMGTVIETMFISLIIVSCISVKSAWSTIVTSCTACGEAQRSPLTQFHVRVKHKIRRVIRCHWPVKQHHKQQAPCFLAAHFWQHFIVRDKKGNHGRNMLTSAITIAAVPRKRAKPSVWHRQRRRKPRKRGFEPSELLPVSVPVLLPALVLQ